MVVLVALVVVGPERLPGFARTAGLWVGKAKRMVNDVKLEIDQELAADELKKTLDKQNLLSDVYEVIEETRQVGQDIKQDIEHKLDTSTNSDSSQTDTGTEKS